ncbi:MAG: hypothetical protein M0Z89_07360 [Nitrospiraceae bacterium]|nr:hypothetical protein [Nitrospiraceae bacterium]
MKKMTGMIIAVAAMLVLASAAFAWWDGPGMGYGPGYYSGANAETMKKFQKETLSLRDEFMTKRIELRSEYDKPAPDTARIAALQKDIIDIQAKIQVVADKNGVPAWGPGPRRGMMTGAGCACRWQ